MQTAFEIVRILVVMALVCVAGVILTPKGRLPLALRGLAKLLEKDRSGDAPAQVGVSCFRRLWGFALIILAFVLSVIRL